MQPSCGEHGTDSRIREIQGQAILGHAIYDFPGVIEDMPDHTPDEESWGPVEPTTGTFSGDLSINRCLQSRKDGISYVGERLQRIFPFDKLDLPPELGQVTFISHDHMR